ncbi:MAG: tetratricopeptide repeat protein [Bacteroidales bacterium]
MKRIIVFVSIVFGAVLAVQAQQQIIEEAEQLYTQQQFDSALVLYTNLLDDGYQSADLYYNIGNVYYKKNDVARAILFYEKAFLLNPHDKDIIHNLEFARSQQVDNIDSVGQGFFARWYSVWYRYFHPNTWIVISIVTFLFFLSGMFLFFFSQKMKYRKNGFFLGVFFLVVSGVAYTSAQSRYHELTAHTYAIVVEPTASIKTEPKAASKDLTVIHGGLKVYVMQKKENWFQIRLSDGNKGWINANYIEKI